MHMHMLMGVVLHTTLLAIVGYALLFSASKASGIVALIGRVLGLWVFLLAALSVAAFVTAPMFGGKPFGMEMHDHGGWMHHGDHDGDRDGDRDGAPDQRVTPPPQATQPAPPPPAPAKP